METKMFYIITAIIVIIAFLLGAFIHKEFSLLDGIFSALVSAAIIMFAAILLNPAMPAEVSEVHDYPVVRQGDNTLYYIDDNKQHRITHIGVTENSEVDQVIYRVTEYNNSDWPKRSYSELLIPTKYGQYSDTRFIVQSLKYVVE